MSPFSIFAHEPGRWFRGAHIETVHFPEGSAGDRIVERVFRGGLTHQLRDCLRHIEGLTTTLITRRPTSPQAGVTRSYPPTAVREALVNAVFHRG